MTETMQAPTPEQERVKERHKNPTATAEQISRIAFKLLQRAGAAQLERDYHGATAVEGLTVSPLDFDGEIHDPNTVRAGEIKTKNDSLSVRSENGGNNHVIETKSKNDAHDKVYEAKAELSTPGINGAGNKGRPSSYRKEIQEIDGREWTVPDTFESLGKGSGTGLETTRDVSAVALGEIRQQIKQQEDLNHQASQTGPVNAAAIRADLGR